MILENYNQLAPLREIHADRDISFCSGSFDLTHPGHGLFFEDCKKDSLLFVLVANDAIIKKIKGPERPIYNQHIRIKAIDLMKPVDYCILQEESPEDEKDYLAPLIPVFEKLRPNRWIFNSDAFDIDRRIKLAEQYGITPIVYSRKCPKEFEEISTTNILKKIKRLNQPY